jgi:hypothetical protein
MKWRRPAAIFLLAMIATSGPAYSQKKSEVEIEIEKKARKAVDDQYKATMDRTKDRRPQPSADPWGSVRETSPSPKKSKPAGPQTKTD